MKMAQSASNSPPITPLVSISTQYWRSQMNISDVAQVGNKNNQKTSRLRLGTARDQTIPSSVSAAANKPVAHQF